MSDATRIEIVPGHDAEHVSLRAHRGGAFVSLSLRPDEAAAIIALPLAEAVERAFDLARRKAGY